MGSRSFQEPGQAGFCGQQSGAAKHAKNKGRSKRRRPVSGPPPRWQKNKADYDSEVCPVTDLAAPALPAPLASVHAYAGKSLHQLLNKTVKGVRAVGHAMRQTAYAEAADQLLTQICGRLPHDLHIPFIALAGRSCGVGVTTTALTLAHAACRRGARVLLIDHNSPAPDLTALSLGSEQIFLEQISQHVRFWAHDATSEGEIFILPAGSSSFITDCVMLDAPLDLVLIDCGDLREAAACIGKMGAVDGIILVTDARHTEYGRHNLRNRKGSKSCEGHARHSPEQSSAIDLLTEVDSFGLAKYFLGSIAVTGLLTGNRDLHRMG